MEFSVGLYLFSCTLLTSPYCPCPIRLTVKASYWETAVLRKPSSDQTWSLATPTNQQLVAGWTGSKSWEFTATNRWTGSISFAFHHDSGIPWYCIFALIKMCWFHQPKAFGVRILAWEISKHTSDRTQTSHQEEIVPFSLLEGGGHARMRDSKYGSLRNICLWSKHWKWRNIHKCQWTKWGHSPTIMLVVLSE